jgi:hypothetical protein
MSKARQIIEAWEFTIRSKTVANEDCEVFSNPSKKELREIGEQIRFLIDADEKVIYVWNFSLAFHRDVAGELRKKLRGRNLLFGRGAKTGSGYVSDDIDTAISLEFLQKQNWTWTQKYSIDVTPGIENILSRFGKEG